MPKKWLFLFLFVIITLGLMTYQSNRQSWFPLKFLKNTFNTFHDLKNSVMDSVKSPFHKMLIREEENRRLKAELAKLLHEQQKYREVLLENQRLKDVLSLKEKDQRYIAGANVIARSTDRWSNTFIIDKGLRHGIEKDMAVVSIQGLVGKISEVSGSYSYLLLVTDMSFSAAARLQESRVEGVVTGSGFRKCRLKYVPYEEEVKKGDIVITSGLDQLFPPGIPVGYVSKVDKSDIGIFQDIEVLPFVDNIKIEVVVIMRRG
jgi:rod shape-determining protein MreC